jgi:hypothetical protein
MEPKESLLTDWERLVFERIMFALERIVDILENEDTKS